MRIIAVALLAVSGSLGLAQSIPTWERSDKRDAFSGASYSEFVLNGKYLQAPQKGDGAPPRLIVRCVAKPDGKVYRGAFGSARLATGTVLSQSGQSIPVMFRLDDGKAQTAVWTPSTDGGSAFIDSASFSNLLYGHILPHKEHTSEPVRKVVIAVDEAFAARVVVEIDMPSPDEVADACGAIFHRR